ncbi:conjugal transfer protein TrbH [Phyllobacterium zundukense]|uniref:Conjugal transfer protein TrbH n=1 Tax=Phyllobacterium zundukense TaxID=1867719 RepID=A0A2N9VT70_9HYPH|nr:conjugal transfer protein TrbH [Phyllobacterium zundukense]ATU95399.1 conjugal transfer protein TrbH [Phyllobacterium zundukense]PIO42688.1 conjugal transfer protein TrbH [Phyllobacterium zundukense]
MRAFAVRPIRRLAIAGLIVLFLSGCQTIGTDGLVASDAPPDVSGPAASAIAGDMVSRLAEQVGSGKVAIALKPDDSPFGQALEAALKGWGYAVVTDQKTDAGKTVIPLAYVVVAFEGQVLTRLSTSKVELGRAYTVTASGATPASALSVLKRG